MNANPARQDATCIFCLACVSFPSKYALKRNTPHISIDFSAKAVEKSFLFVLTQASIACVKTSIPVSAVIAGGTLFTNSASKIVSSGVSDSDTSGYFLSASRSETTANEVTSEPVPLVVGIAINPTSP